MRQVDLVLSAGGGGIYRGYLRRTGSNPTFDRGTIITILKDIQRLENDYSTKSESSDAIETESTAFDWESGVLVVTGRAVGGGPIRIQPDPEGRYALFDASDWVELRRVWPFGSVSASALLELLARPMPAPAATLDRVRSEVSTSTVVEAEQAGNDATKELLLRVLADRHEPEAVAAITAELESLSPTVRAEAAHALEHRGIGDWGRELLLAALREPDGGVQEMMIRAIAATGYELARPWLEGLVANPASDIRISEAARMAIRSFSKDR